MSYEVQGNTLIGFVDNQVDIGSHYDAGTDRLVFTFQLNAGSGDFQFKLYDQLDHDAPFDDPGDGSGLADQNFDLVDSDPNNDVSSLNFGHVIKVTDFDGDSVILDGKVDIKIRDDIPEVKCGETVYGVVEEEQLSKGNEDNLDQNGLDLDPPSNDTTATVSGNGANSLASLIEVGADENGKFTFRDHILNDVVKDKNGNTVTSDGHTVRIEDIDHGHDSGGDFTLITAEANGHDIFTLKVYEDGDWQFTLKDQIDHPDHTVDNGSTSHGSLEEFLKSRSFRVPPVHGFRRRYRLPPRQQLPDQGHRRYADCGPRSQERRQVAAG